MSFGSFGGSLVTARVLFRPLDEAGAQGIADLEALVDRRRGPRGTPEARTVEGSSPALLVSPPNDPAPLGLR